MSAQYKFKKTIELIELNLNKFSWKLVYEVETNGSDKENPLNSIDGLMISSTVLGLNVLLLNRDPASQLGQQLKACTGPTHVSPE